MRKMSVKLKIVLWYTAAIAIISAVVFIATTSFGKDMLKRDIIGRVTRTVTDGSRQIVGPDGVFRPRPDFRFYENGVHMLFYDSDGNLAGGQVPFGIHESIDFEDNKVRLLNLDGNDYYVYDREIRRKDSPNTYWLRGIVSAAGEAGAMNTVAKNNLILTVFMIVFSSLGGYFIVKRAFIPVDKISKTAKRISESTDLSQRINIGNGNDEIYRLANTFDEMLDRLEQTFEREKQFTSDASHELRTPAAVIISECEYMLDCASTEEEFKESALSVKRQAEKMSKLISELLTISRMDKNTIKTEFEETDISELLSFVCDEQEEIQNGEVKLVRDFPEGITAEADRFLIARLFINLISNAYQYIGNGDTVRVSLAKEGKNIVFSVKDNGIGISDEDIPKIWERFYQADSSRTDNGSMGLGLSMVKWIAQCHGGSIDVVSESGKGSEFVFTFPQTKKR